MSSRNRIPIETEKLIIEEYKKGKSSGELGKEFDLHRTTILKILKRNGVKRRKAGFRKLDVPQQKEVLNLYEQGMTQTAIGKKVGVEGSTINEILRKYGIPREKYGKQNDKYLYLEEQQDEIVRDYIYNKLTCVEIAKKHNVSEATIYRFLRAKNIEMRLPKQRRSKILYEKETDNKRLSLDDIERIVKNRQTKLDEKRKTKNEEKKKTIKEVRKKKIEDRLSEEQLYAVMHDYMSGLYTIKELSRKYKCSPKAVSMFLKNNNVSITSKHKKEDFVEKNKDAIIMDYLKGMTQNELCAKYTTYRQRIRNLLKNNGIEIRYDHKKTFDEKKEEQIIEEYKKGSSVKELAEVYKVTTTIVYNVLKRHNIKRRSNKLFNEKQEEEICNMYIGGKTSTKIAEELNCTYGVICAILHKNNIKMRNSGTYIVFTEKQEKDIVSQYNNGKTLEEIGNIYGVSTDTISRCLKANNVDFTRRDTTKLGSHEVRQCCDCGNIYPLEMFCKDKGAAMGRSYHCKFCHDEEGYKRKFGLSMDEVLAMEEKQNGLCAICGRQEQQIKNGRRIRLAIDHDQITGKIREMLCSKCNQLLGMWDDNITNIESAIQYLINSEKPGFRPFVLCNVPSFDGFNSYKLDTYSFTVPAEGTLYTHGITLDQYRYVYSEQSGCCKICGKHAFDNRYGILAIDHDHKHKKRDPAGIRGLLCNFCNAAIGLAREDIGILKSAIAYLKRHGKIEKEKIEYTPIRTDNGPYELSIRLGYDKD